MTTRRELTLAIVGLLVGGGLLLLSAGRTWATVGRAAPFHGSVAASGGSLVPATTAVGLLALAAVAAVVATRGMLRVLTGAVVFAAGVAVAALAAGGVSAADVVAAAGPHGQLGAVAPGPPELSAWPWVAVGGGAVLAAAGLLVAVRGRRWSAMGSRYDAPTPARRRAVDPEVAAWEALDRGEDPTVGGRYPDPS